jgi:uncharacterized membrane protein YgdD (TMEM256/DUF423 family)
MLKKYTIIFSVFCLMWALFSTVLDEIFFYIDFGKNDGFLISLITYVGVIIVLYGLIVFPFLFIYDLLLSKVQLSIWGRIALALIIGLIVASVINKNYYSFYIGTYRIIKGYILFSGSLISLELFTYYFFRKKEGK